MNRRSFLAALERSRKWGAEIVVLTSLNVELRGA